MTPVPFACSHHVQPICLPLKGQTEAFDNTCEVSGWGYWSQAQGSSLMGQSVSINLHCSATLTDKVCVDNPSATLGKNFTFDDGMPLSCKNVNKQLTYLRGLHAKKLDRCQDGCPTMQFIQIRAYLDWINARLAL